MTSTNLPADAAEEAQRVRAWLCLACATPLPEDAPPHRTYCGDSCRRAYNRYRARATAPATRSGRCAHCGDTFTQPRTRGPIPTYCSDSCQYKARHAREYVATPHQPLKTGKWRHKPGGRFGSLVILERLPGSKAVVVCDCGTTGKVVAIRNMTAGLVKHCAGPAHRHMNDVTTYSGAHRRVTALRGPARAHLCAMCKTAPAQDWAYDHGDPSQRCDTTGKDAGRVYSLRPDRYKALCRTCHGRWDKARRRQAPLDGLSLAHVALAMLCDDTETDETDDSQT